MLVDVDMPAVGRSLLAIGHKNSVKSDWTDEALTFLRSLAPLPAEEWAEFKPHLRQTKLAAGESLVFHGGPCETVGLIRSGLMKTFYVTSKGAEFIRNFSAEGELVAAYVPLLSGQQNADVTILAMEPCDLIVTEFSRFRERLARHWTWQQISRIMAEQNYLRREKRQYELLTMSAAERFESFLASWPGLISRITQQDLAAYVGVTPESMSRLRSRRKARGAERQTR